MTEILDNLKKKQDEEFDDKFFYPKTLWAMGLDGKWYDKKDVKDFIDKVRSETAEAVAREAETREKLFKDMHRIELDAVSCMSVERFVVWSANRRPKFGTLGRWEENINDKEKIRCAIEAIDNAVGDDYAILQLVEEILKDNSKD